MEEVGPTGFGAVVAVGRGADDLADHGEATDGGGQGVGQADGEQVAIHIGAALVGVEEIDGLGAEQGFEATDEGEHDDPLEAFRREDDGEIREAHGAEEAAGKMDEVLGTDFEFMAGPGVEVLVGDVEENAEGGGDHENKHGAGDPLHDGVLDVGTEEEDEEADEADEGDFGIEIGDGAWDFGQEFERFLGVGANPDGDVSLLGDDDDADGGEHAMDGGNGEEFGEGADAEQAEDDLNETGHDTDGEGAFVAENGVALTEPLNGAEGNDDEAGGGAFDGELGVGQERGDHATQNRGEDAGDGGKATGQRDAEAERKGNEEDKESAEQVIAPVALKAI